MLKPGSCLRKGLLAIFMVSFVLGATARGNHPGLVLRGQEGPGRGKRLVFVTGDEEYRSEQSMPALAKIAAARHGFDCTVLFAVNKQNGTIDPITYDNIPGLKSLDEADLMVMFLRFRRLPEEQMKHILRYVDSGKPMIAVRTSTHPFSYDKDSPLVEWSFRAPKGGFGGRVFGQTWIKHHGSHLGTSTRAYVVPRQVDHPVLRGVAETFWCPSDVYEVLPLRGECVPLVLGEVTDGKSPKGRPRKNKVPQPIVWTKIYRGPGGKSARVLTTTLGHPQDFQSEDVRRLLINAIYWCLGMEEMMPERTEVDFIGPYAPDQIGLGNHRKGIRPADLLR
ncbi:MAG: ThuA domain-containing protein [Pirellulales bacterium]|nr:ThuA domain-containing protein [Pirellulales bacterium]